MKTKLITLFIVGLTALTGTATIYAAGGVEPLKARVKNWVKPEIPSADLQDDEEELPGALTTEDPLTEETHFRGRYCLTPESTEEPTTDSPEEPKDVHPQAKKLAAELEGIDEYQIMTWFCEDGFGFGEMKQAYKISLEANVAISDVLGMRENYGWGQIKQMCDNDNDEEGCDSTFTPKGLKKNGKTPGKWQDNGDDTGSGSDENQPGNKPLENPGKGLQNKPNNSTKSPKK